MPSSPIHNGQTRRIVTGVDFSELAASTKHVAILDLAMCCQACGASPEWPFCRDGSYTRFACPECGTPRQGHSAPARCRREVGERDGWICHRCGQPIDAAVKYPDPQCAVADHYPVPENMGGPAIPANLRIAHHACNGSAGGIGWRPAGPPRTEIERRWAAVVAEWDERLMERGRKLLAELEARMAARRANAK